MRVPRSILIVSGVLALATCVDADPTALDPAGARGLGLVPGPPGSFCGAATVVDLVADEVVVVGTVEVVNVEGALFVTFRTGADAPLTKTAVAVEGDPAQIPANRQGNPQPGKFSYKANHRSEPTSVTWQVEGPVDAGAVLHVAAFAEVLVDGEKEGAWGGGEAINPSAGWATRFTHTVQACDGTIIRTVPPTGGTILTAGLELVIPDGSLGEATTFFIAPTTLDVPDLPIVAGTAWQIEPSGTTFDPPALLTLAYRSEDLPTDFPQGNLKCVVVSGGVSELIRPAGIDQVDHLITCPLTHLSIVAVAAPGGGPITEAIGVTDEVTIYVRSPARPDVAETVGVSDLVTVDVRSPARPDVAETVGVSDLVTVDVRSPARPDVAETIGVSDLVTVDVRPPETADLSILFASASGNPVDAGDPVTFTAFLVNAGPDAVTDAVVRYQMFGDAIAGPLGAGCSEVGEPAAADVEIACAVGAVAVDPLRPVTAPPATFVPQSPGDYTVWVDPGSSATDPNAANDRFETTVTALGPNADLRLTRVTDSHDPVLTGSDVSYRVDFILAGTTDPVDGAVVNVLFTGVDAEFLSSPSGCTPSADGVSCALETMNPGVSRSVEFVMDLPAAGVVTAAATIIAPEGLLDTDPSNNTAEATTTVEAQPPASISVGEIIESVKRTDGDTTWYSLDLAAPQLVRLHLSLLDGDGSAQLIVKVAGADTTIYPGRITTGNAQPGLSANVVLGLLGSTPYRVGVRGTNSGRYRLGAGTGAGRLDRSFGNQFDGDGNPVGFAFGPFDSGNPFRAMAVVGDATLIVGDEALTKFADDGTLDASFGAGGSVDLNAVLNAFATALAVQPDGRIVVVADRSVSPQPWIVARFDATGALDPTFGVNGIVEVTSFASTTTATPTAVGFQQNGADLDIVVSGVEGSSQNQLGMIRLNPDGSIDTAFGIDGIVSEGAGFMLDGMEIQPDGRILITDSRNLRRYTADGARDATFGAGGLVDYANHLGITGGAHGLTVLPAGDLLVVGLDMNDGFIMRLTSTGALDASFAGGGYQRYHFGHSELFKDVTLTPTGDLVAVGHQRTLNGGWEWLIVKTSADGLVDPDFGILGYTIEGRGDEARAAAFDSMGRLIVGGQQMGAGNRIELSRHFMN